MKLCHSRGLHQTFSYGTSLWYHLLHILPLKKYCFFCDFDIIAMKCASQPLGHYQDKVQHIHSIQTLTPFRPTPLHQLRQLGIPSVQWRTHLFCKKDWNKSGCLQYSTQIYDGPNGWEPSSTFVGIVFYSFYGLKIMFIILRLYRNTGYVCQYFEISVTALHKYLKWVTKANTLIGLTIGTFPKY